jgi:outer membrane protein assembly factor BamB
MLVVLDPEANSIVWALRGSWRQQHDVKMLPNGHILLFDNQGALMSTGRSRVLEVLPTTGAIVWSFRGTDEDPLDSEIRGGAQRLIGGNTLISESAAGRILEVTPDGTVVWEYVNPLVAVENGHKLIASLGLTVTRYDPSYVSFIDGKQHF